VIGRRGLRATSEASSVRRDRGVAVASLLALIALAWLYLWFDAARMHAMPMGTAPMDAGAMTATSGQLVLTFLMWSVMMVGMMLPSAMPAILLYASMAGGNRGFALSAVWMFTAGYLVIWIGFSLAASVLQVGLTSAALLTPMMASANAWLSGGLLIAAGVYQWVPVKDVCLEKCRAPLQFFLFNWCPGLAGAFRMGVKHGAFCVGCCWVLMLILFAVGVMNLLWVALIAGFVLAEKLLPAGRLVGRTAGIALAAAGGYLIAAG
jgi:predicted metal-binding membrane protein